LVVEVGYASPLFIKKSIPRVLFDAVDVWNSSLSHRVNDLIENDMSFALQPGIISF